MKLINMTPHAITLIVGDMQTVIQPSGAVARCTTQRNVVGSLTVNGIEVPVTETIFGTVTGLPEPVEGTGYIVSALVAQACPDRHDLCIPDDSVRDAEGRIVGCKALAFNH